MKARTATTALAAAVVLAATSGASAASRPPNDLPVRDAPRLLDQTTVPQLRTRHAGRPLVVHVWGMTCGPCVAELPRWGAFRRAHPAIEVVLVQADESAPDDAERRLRDAGLGGVAHFAVAGEPDEYLRASIDPSWAGDLPRTLLIGADGGVERIRGTADFDAVRRWALRQPSTRVAPASR